jgi:hypothetical protein
MSNAQRRKGLRGEAEVAAILRTMPAVTVQNLEGQGDLAVWMRRAVAYETPEAETVQVVSNTRVQLHVEVKRQNRLRTEWIAQAEREAAAGAVPVVAWRPDGGRWWAMIPLEDLARLLA